MKGATTAEGLRYRNIILDVLIASLENTGKTEWRTDDIYLFLFRQVAKSLHLHLKSSERLNHPRYDMDQIAMHVLRLNKRMNRKLVDNKPMLKEMVLNLTTMLYPDSMDEVAQNLQILMIPDRVVLNTRQVATALKRYRVAGDIDWYDEVEPDYRTDMQDGEKVHLLPGCWIVSDEATGEFAYVGLKPNARSTKFGKIIRSDDDGNNNR